MLAIYPELLQLAAEKDIETLAIRARKYFCHEEEATKPQLDLLHLSQNIGIALKSSNHSFFATLVCVDKLGEFKVSGLINEAFTPTDQRFLLAHIIGHLFLHIIPKIAKSEIDGSIGFQESSCPLKLALSEAAHDIQEQEATDFALALLMPKGMFLRAQNKLRQVRNVANFFGLHPHAVELRHARLERGKGIIPNSFIMAEKLVEEEKSLKRQGAEIKTVQKKNIGKPLSVDSIKEEPRAKPLKNRGTIPPQPPTNDVRASLKKSPLPSSISHLKGMEKIRTIAKMIEEQKQNKEE